MKKVAIITMAVQLENEPGNTRQRYLADLLVKNGYEVDLITSTFQHWEKVQRNLGGIRQEDYAFHLKFIYEPGYKKNVEFRRLHSHRIAAKNLKTLLEREGNYDLIYAEMPPNDVALVAAEYAKERQIPFVIDVTTLWPEAMRMVVDLPVISDVLFRPLEKDAEKVYAMADGIVATSDEYRARPFLHQERVIPSLTIYGGNEIAVFDQGARDNEAAVFKAEDEFWVTYAGTIGTSQDIKTLVLTAEELAKRGLSNVRFKIIGNGPLREELRTMADVKEIFNIEFVGYLSYDKLAAYLSKSDILVNSFVKKAPQSIVSKIGDYVAAGKPIVNSCTSQEVCRLLETEQIGINILPENVDALTNVIEDLYENEAKRASMGEHARQIAKERFDRPQSYQKIVKMIETLMNQSKGKEQEV